MLPWHLTGYRFGVPTGIMLLHKITCAHTHTKRRGLSLFWVPRRSKGQRITQGYPVGKYSLPWERMERGSQSGKSPWVSGFPSQTLCSQENHTWGCPAGPPWITWSGHTWSWCRNVSALLAGDPVCGPRGSALPVLTLGHERLVVSMC